MEIFWFHLFTILLFIFVAIKTYYVYCFLYWKLRGIPTLNPIVPFGDAIKLPMGKVNLGELLSDWYFQFKSKGAFHGGAYLCGKPIYLPVDPKIVKKVMISDSDYFPNHPFYIDESGNDPLSMHMFNLESSKWRNVRSKLPQAFTSAKMRQMFLVMRELTSDLTNHLDKLCSKQTPIDIKSVLSCFTIDILTACAYGVQSKTLQNQNLELLRYGREFFDYQWSRTKNFLVFLVPRYILNMLQFRIFTKSATAYFMDMYSKIVEQRANEPTKRNDLAELLIRLTDKNDDLLKNDFEAKKRMEPLSFDELVAQFNVFFAAGFETSSSTQAFGLLELAININCQEKLRKEVNKVLKRHGGNLTYDAIMEMEYLDRVVDETLRKYPILPLIPRICVKDYYIPEEHVTIEKGTITLVSNWGLQMDPEYWPDPKKFDPDRFTVQNKGTRPAMAYLPFGEGPRICIGKRFGLLQTKVGLVTVIQNYKVTVGSKTKFPLRLCKAGTVLSMDGGVWLDLEKI